ncbi:MAG: alpha/beta hydrolase [Alphaproteobacteria bacterium]|nr:alpha/beta hydrolase [Alphaproteobacteria bacterium]
MSDFLYSTFSPRAGVSLAYRRFEGGEDFPGVIFLGGFKSDMTGGKATFLEEACTARNQSFVRFDYTGHGFSSGVFEDGMIGSWLQDALDVFDTLTTGPQIVVGSSMGGWISLLLALKRKERVHGLIGIAAAPDFSEDILHHELTDTQKAELEEKGITYKPSDYGDPYPITKKLLDEARENHLLLHDKINITCPVRLLHGKQDDAVPWQKSERIKQKLVSKDVQITWVDDGDHRLSRDQDLALLDAAVRALSRP